jgi:hypothetical protein
MLTHPLQQSYCPPDIWSMAGIWSIFSIVGECLSTSFTATNMILGQKRANFLVGYRGDFRIRILEEWKYNSSSLPPGLVSARKVRSFYFFSLGFVRINFFLLAKS